MLKLISINIERSKHLDLMWPFLEREKADIVCLQELMEYDIPQFHEVLGGLYVFAPMTRVPAEGKPGVMGQAIFSRFPIVSHETKFYTGSADTIPEQDMSNAEAKHASQSASVLFCNIEANTDKYRIATTHFTWTPHGDADDYQRQDLKAMFAILDTYDQFALCGDFNAPRGGEIFSGLAERYTDNIPPEYKTSLDINLHYAGKLRPHELANKMVDGLFTTPCYRAENVELVFGVSDHAAIVADMYIAGDPA